MTDANFPAAQVAIIGTGDGGVPLTSGVIGKTPDHLPNLVLRVISPPMAIIVRAIVAFLTGFSGVLTAAGLGGSHLFGASDLHGVLVIASWTGLCSAIP